MEAVGKIGLLGLIVMVALALMALVSPMIEALKAVDLGTTSSVESLEIEDVYDEEMDNALSMVVIDPAYSHAVEEHPADAQIVRDCFAQKGAYVQFQVKKNERYLRVCVIDEATGLIGFQIVDIINRVAKERTAYIKDNIRSLKALFDYAKRMGYPRFTRPL